MASAGTPSRSRSSRYSLAVVAYVSGHGLGHSAREVTVLRDLPPEIPLFVKTAAPEWFWRAEVKRPFTLLPESFDVGCLQTDSMTVDIAATRAAWEGQNQRNEARRADEIAWLRSVNARLVLTDVASFPLTLGLPSVCVANFTWADIYTEYAGFEGIVAQLEAEYAQATLLLEAGLALPMPYFPRRESVGLVARVGKNRIIPPARRGPGSRAALIYAGSWGMPFPWASLERFVGWTFYTLTPPPRPWPGNLIVLSRDTLPHEDLVASVDCVISKAGYGLVGECMAAGTPLLYGPREGFAEFAALDAALQGWDGGMRLESGAFLSAQWPLEGIPTKGSVSRLPTPGAAATIVALVKLWSTD